MTERLAVLGGADHEYRYRLERRVLPYARTAFVGMVNPSTADSLTDDHTVTKVDGFALRLDIGRVLIGNKFARRSKDVAALRLPGDPIGPENDAHLEAMMAEADMHIVAWGPLAKLPPHLRTRWRSVVAIADRLGAELMCWGVAQDGQPRHPLMLAYDTPLVPWRRP